MYLKEEQCKLIKRLLERLSGVQDIGARNRNRELSDIRKTYYKLCQQFSLASSTAMADALGGYDHSTALHNIIQFNNLYGSDSFTCNELYDESKEILQKLYNEKMKMFEKTEQKKIIEQIKILEDQIQTLINQLNVDLK
jgi:hypothetical protein